jgi:hypothetical protein
MRRFSLTIAWHKPPSRRSRRILLPHNASRSEIRPEQFERRARLVNAIAKGRRWLDDVVSGRVTNVTQLRAREVQRSAGQHDDLARLPRTQPCQSSRRKSSAAWYRRGGGSAIRRQNGAGNSRRSDSIRNSCSAGPRSRITVARKSELRLPIRPEYAPAPPATGNGIFGCRDRAPKSPRSNAPPYAETKVWELGGRKSPQKRPVWRPTGNMRFARAGWWAHQGSNLGPDD